MRLSLPRRQALALLLFLAAALGLGALADPMEADTPSITNRGPGGLRAAWRYLEERGHPVESWDHPLSTLLEGSAEGLLVIACPLPVPFSQTDGSALRAWLDRGGNAVLLSSGAAPGPSELALLAAAGMVPRRGAATLGFGWESLRAGLERDRRLRGGGLTLVERRSRWALEVDPATPVGPPPILWDEGGGARAWRSEERAGTLLVIDNSSVLANAWLAEADNLRFLEHVVAPFAGAGSVRFDEWHQGHGVDPALSAESLRLPLRLLLLQAALLYLLGLWALSRPFARPVGAEAEQRRLQGSVDRDLRGLARLHHQAGHAPGALVALRAAAQRQARRRGLDEARLELPIGEDEKTLLETARRVGALQADGRM